MDWKERAEELVDQHWNYHDVIIPIFMEDNASRYHKNHQASQIWGNWYKEIGKHFYKHAIADLKAGIIEIE